MNNKKRKLALLLFSVFMLSSFSYTMGSSFDMNIVEAKLSSQEATKSKQSYQQGLDYYGKNDIKNAAMSFMEASKVDKENPLYAMFSADTLHLLKQYPSSIRYYNLALDNLKHAKKDLRDKIKIKSYMGLSNNYLAQKDKDNALKYANKLISDFPKDYRGNLILGNIYSDDVSTYPLAIDSYKASLAINKEQPDSYVKLIKVYNKNKDLENVIKTYKDAIDYRPLDLKMKMALAQVYISHKNPKDNSNYYNEAIQVLIDLVNVDAKNDFAHYYLGTLYTLISNNSKAEEELGILNQINPNLGDKLGKEIQAYRIKHANDKDNTKDTNVTVNEETGQTTITITSKKNKEAFVPGTTKEEISLDDNDKKSKPDKLIEKQVNDLEKNIIKEKNKHDSSSASNITTLKNTNKLDIKINKAETK